MLRNGTGEWSRLAQEVNVLERQHQLLLATTEYEAKAEAAKELQPCVSRLSGESSGPSSPSEQNLKLKTCAGEPSWTSVGSP